MPRLFSLIAALALILSFGMAPLSHAMEPANCLDVAGCASIVQSDANTDHAPADKDKPCPHQHGGCHGHHVAASAHDLDALSHALYRTAPWPGQSAGRTGTGIDPALRPPQA